MPPDQRRPALDDPAEPSVDVPFDADLEALDEELATAGEQARRMLYGRSQPTRLFSNALRARLLGGVQMTAVPQVQVAAFGVAAVLDADRPPLLVPAEAPRARSVPAPDPHPREGSLRVILAMLAIASMVVLLAAGSLTGTFGPALP
jgi:hypothetical protein